MQYTFILFAFSFARLLYMLCSSLCPFLFSTETNIIARKCGQWSAYFPQALTLEFGQGAMGGNLMTLQGFPLVIFTIIFTEDKNRGTLCVSTLYTIMGLYAHLNLKQYRP